MRPFGLSGFPPEDCGLFQSHPLFRSSVALARVVESKFRRCSAALRARFRAFLLLDGIHVERGRRREREREREGLRLVLP